MKVKPKPRATKLQPPRNTSTIKTPTKPEWVPLSDFVTSRGNLEDRFLVSGKALGVLKRTLSLVPDRSDFILLISSSSSLMINSAHEWRHELKEGWITSLMVWYWDFSDELIFIDCFSIQGVVDYFWCDLHGSLRYGERKFMNYFFYVKNGREKLLQFKNG